MIEKKITATVQEALGKLYGFSIESSELSLQKTRSEFEGDFTLIVFPYTRFSKKSPQDTASEIGDFLVKNNHAIISFNVVKGFLNLSLSDKEWLEFFESASEDRKYGFIEKDENKKVVIEFSSPNTNKPLHLGHIRNILLGYSLSLLLEANGYKVYKVNLVNDRGIHICKSMLAWQKWGNNETPSASGIKGDHLIGKYYVMFEKEYREQINKLEAQGMDSEQAKNEAPLIKDARNLLKRWEGKDPEVHDIWKTMNGWAYEGFDETYERLGVSFDKVYYESDTFLLGKDIVKEGINQKVFIKKEDGSVWADLSDEGLDEKLLLRADGTSVYITQDLGTAELRVKDFKPQTLVYVVGNEQIYHFDVLKLLFKKLNRPWYDAIYHLSYGMVELPEGKMKSREGKVVDADDLLDEMYTTSKNMTNELGKIDGFSAEEAHELYRMVGLGALKYFILKVDPKKTMTFNPSESVDFNGNTGPFIQYTYARIQSVLRKSDPDYDEDKESYSGKLAGKEKDLLHLLYEYPTVVKQAGNNYSPAVIANYAYELAKEFNQFYHDYSILNAASDELKQFRIELSAFTAKVISSAMGLLGIEMPEKM